MNRIQFAKKITRRNALKNAALATIGSSFLFKISGLAAAESSTTQLSNPLKFELGLTSFSLSTVSLDELIAALQKLRLKNVALFKTHCHWDGNAEECRAVAEKFKDAGIKVTGSGVIKLTNDEAVVRRAFENARAADLPTMICSPTPDSLSLVEKYVKEYDQRLAIHNHGPEDKLYPSPFDAWKAIQPYDQRIGMCLDVGHSARMGVDPVAVIHKCKGRLYDLHLKDSIAPVGAMKDVPIEVGRGHLDIKGILAALIEIKYSHIVGLEYEKTGDNRFAGLEESVGYIRKTLSQLPS